MDDFTRRDVIRLGTAATLSASLGGGEALAQAVAPPAPKFFTAEEFALVDELSELIVPTDDHSPGARAAKVADYIDARLAEAWDPAEKMAWRDGLKLVDRMAHERSGKTFMQSSGDDRIAVLTRMAEHEGKPQRPDERFFAELKERVVYAYYTSRIGIRQEMEYKGNGLLTEFEGFAVGGGDVRR
jgi:hypothetical protein